MSDRLSYWGDGSPWLLPDLSTEGVDYWGDGHPYDLIAGEEILIVELDTPPEISIIALTIAGMEFGFNMPEQPNMAMDAATVASTEISLAVYTENLQIIPLDPIAVYVVEAGKGEVTIIGYAPSVLESVELDTLSDMEIEALDIVGFEYGVGILEIVDLVIEIFDVSVIIGGRRLFPIPLAARRKNEPNAGKRLFPVLH